MYYFLIPIILFYLVRFCFIGVSRIVSESMSPTLLIDDFVLFNKWGRNPKVNDIILFKHEDKLLIKRVSNVLEDKVYVLGDNKRNSKDSRSFGYIPKSSIKGTAFRILVSIDKKNNTTRKDRTWRKLDAITFGT